MDGDGRLIGEEKLVMERWPEYFKDLFSESENEVLNVDMNEEHEDDGEDFTPTREEVEYCIKK